MYVLFSTKHAYIESWVRTQIGNDYPKEIWGSGDWTIKTQRPGLVVGVSATNWTHHHVREGKVSAKWILTHGKTLWFIADFLSVNILQIIRVNGSTLPRISKHLSRIKFSHLD